MSDTAWPTASAPPEAGDDEPPRFRFQFSIASLLGLMTWTALVSSLGALSGLAAIALAVPSVPAWFVAAAAAAWRRESGYPMRRGEQVRMFLAATLGMGLFGGVLAVYVGMGASIVAFLTVFTASRMLGLTGTVFAGWVGTACGAIVGAVVFLLACRLVAIGLWHQQRMRLAAWQSRAASSNAEIGRG